MHGQNHRAVALTNEFREAAASFFVVHSIIVYTNDSVSILINYQKYNSSVILDNPDDIVYLYRLSQNTPLPYAKSSLKTNGLQRYGYWWI